MERDLFDACLLGDLSQVTSLSQRSDISQCLNWENPEKHGRSALHAAVLSENLQVIEFLIEKLHADTEKADVAGKIPLDVAWENNSKDIVALLKHTSKFMQSI